jgi:hypothetical protein
MDAHARNSRWSREPKLNKAREPIIARLSEHDLAILKLLARYRYLPSDYLAALTGRSLSALQARLEILYRKPNACINRPHQQRLNADANTTRLIYELDDRSADELRPRSHVLAKKYLRNFAHELMTCTIAASFEIGGNSTTHSNSELAAAHRHPANAARDKATYQSAKYSRLNETAGSVSRVIGGRSSSSEIAAQNPMPSFWIPKPIAARSRSTRCGQLNASIRNKFVSYLSALNQDVPTAVRRDDVPDSVRDHDPRPYALDDGVATAARTLARSAGDFFSKTSIIHVV